jgi:hypothetical protein
MSSRVLRGCAPALLAAMLVGAGIQTSPAGGETHPEWGKTRAPDQVLKKGCNNYRYHYRLTPPEGTWALETFIKGPRGKRLASGAFSSDFDPNRDWARFRICKATTRVGRFTIKAKVSVQNGPVEYTEGWLEPSHFRMTRR